MEPTIESLREEITFLKEALKEAGDFAMRRLPHDMREINATPAYFQKLFMDCATESLNNGRNQIVEESISQLDAG